MLKALLYVVFGLMVLAQFTSLNKSSGFNIYLFDLGVIVFALIGIFRCFLSHQMYIPRGFLLSILFICSASISLLANFHSYDTQQLWVASFYLVRFFFYFLAGLVTYNMLMENEISVKLLVRLMIYSGVLIAFFGVLQLIFLPDFEALDSALGWDPHKSRLASTFFDPNFAAAFLVVSFALAFDTLSRVRKPTFWSVSSIAFLLGSVFLTFSRSGWLFLSVVVLLYGLYRTKKLLLIALVLAFSAYFAVPRIQTRISGITDPADSAHFRFISWTNTIEIIKDHPIFGVGYNTFRYVQQNYGFIEFGTLGGNSGAGADASLLFVFATTGVIGLTLYLVSYLFFMLRAYTHRDKSYNFAVFTILLGLLLDSVFINSLFYPQILFILFMLFGLVEFSSSHSLADT